MDMYDVLIVGAGVAGMNAALYASRAGMNVALVERGLYGGALNDTSEIENYLAFENIGGGDLAEKMEEHVQAQDNITHIYGDIVSINKNADEVFTTKTNKKEIRSLTVVVATGVSHKKLGVLREHELTGKGVSYCAMCDGNFFKGKHVLVIGGGNSALDEALYLSNVVDKVTIIHRGKTFRADQILQDRVRSKNNIRINMNMVVNEFVGEDSLARAKVTIKGKETEMTGEIFADGAFIYIGVIPTTKFIEDSSVSKILSEEGYVITDDKMRTSIKGLYAVGDVRHNNTRQVIVAASDGAVGALSAHEYIQENF